MGREEEMGQGWGRERDGGETSRGAEREGERQRETP